MVEALLLPLSGLTLLPPVIDQTINRVPLSAWSAVGFAIVALGALLLAYRRSSWCIALLVFAVPFAAYRDAGQTTITIEKCLALGTVIGLLASGASLIPRTRGARLVLLLGVAMLGTVALSFINAAFPTQVIREFFKQAEYLVLFWCAATLMERSSGTARAFYLGAIASALVVSVYALGQGTIGGAPSGIWVNGHPLPRVAGSLEGPNQLAGYFESALPVLWTASLALPSLQVVPSVTTFASVSALILTQSRAGIFVAALAFAALWLMKKVAARRSLVATALGAVAGFGLLAAWYIIAAHVSIRELLQLFAFTIPQQPGGVGTRGQLWPAALAMFARHPLVGVGAGNYELLLPSVGLHGIRTQAGSLWLQTLAEQGIIGFTVSISFYATALVQTLRLRTQSALALAAFLALASLLVHQTVDNLFFYPKVAAMCWLLLGAGVAVRFPEPQPKARNGEPQGLVLLEEHPPLAGRT